LNKESSYRIPLEELLALIKASGYELSVQQILEIQSTLLSASVSRMELVQLKFLLTPIIAKNAGDQHHIHQIIDAYIAKKIKREAPPVRPVSLWLHEHKQLVFALKITAFLLIALTGILFYLFTNTKVKTTAIPKTIATVQHDSNTTAETPKPVNPVTRSSVKQPVKPDKGPVLVVQGSGRSIVPVANNFNLQMSLTFGTIAGIVMAWIVFYERRKKMEMKEKQRTEDAIFVTRGEKKRSSGSGFEPEGTLAQPTVQFPERDYLIHQPRALHKIKSHFKKPAAIQNPALHIQKSIYKSVRNAGFSSPVYSNEWKDRRYLFLIDETNPEAHLSSYLNYVVTLLCTAITTVARYSFRGNMATVYDQYGNKMTLDALANQYEGFHLMIIGTGYPFFVQGQLPKELKDTFQRWKYRSVITPVPLPNWGGQEALLQKNDFLLVPEETAAIELLAKTIAEDGSLSPEQITKRLEGSYGLKDQYFQSAQGLKQYLNDEKLFQLVCSLAVYPRLQWALTLALFNALLNSNKEEESAQVLDHDLLLKIVRIPWLNADKLTDNIRLQLLNSLTVETEIIARETILGLLDEVRTHTPVNSPVFTEIDTQYNINAFFLYSHDQYKYRKYAGVKQVFNDYWNDLTEWALKEHVDKSGNALMPRYKSKQATVQEFLINEKQFERWNVNFTRVVLVTQPAILIYISFALFKPAFVYPPENFKNVSFSTILEKASSCTQKLPYAINTTNGGSDTILLNQLNAVDTLHINNVRYNEQVTLEIWTKDSLMKQVAMAARDSFVTVKANCD
jgi:hypothetical protein